MAYILPRVFIVLIGWGITCGIMVNLWPRVDATTFVIAGASWALAGILCFGHMHRLRIEVED